MSKVLYPGSFNPITKGHMNIIEQACNIFDEVLIAVMFNSLKKQELFSIEERLKIIQQIYKDYPNVSVIADNGASVDVALKNGCKAMIRGVRNTADFDFEAQLNYINKDISNNEINTVLLLPDAEYQHLSSTMVRELYRLNKDTSKYVHPVVEQELQKKKEM